jgi:hypothetical protein
VVPALAVLLVLAVAAAIGVLVLGPRIVAGPPSTAPVVSGPVVSGPVVSGLVLPVLGDPPAGTGS